MVDQKLMVSRKTMVNQKLMVSRKTMVNQLSLLHRDFKAQGEKTGEWVTGDSDPDE